MQQASDAVVSASMHAKQNNSASSSQRTGRKILGTDGQAHAYRQETPAQEADAMEEIEEVLSAPDQPEDRVEVVIMSQERRSKVVAKRIGQCRAWLCAAALRHSRGSLELTLSICRCT